MLLENNRRWAEGVKKAVPSFFERLSHHQQPRFFWIGCSDSRVPANEIVGLAPGELFVHRNVANLVREDDPNCMAALQYAVESLEVRDIIVCGHTGCGGVRAAEHGGIAGSLRSWLSPLEALCRHHLRRIPAGDSPRALTDALCEASAMEQAAAVAITSTVWRAWSSGRELAVHAWLYDISTGLIRALGEPLRDDQSLRSLLARLGHEDER